MIYSIKEICRRVAPVAKKYNIPAIYLFGSYARGEATEHSDIDFVIDINGSDIRTAFDYGGLSNDLDSALEKDFDSITLRQLEEGRMIKRLPRMIENVKRDMVKIYDGKGETALRMGTVTWRIL
jgi:predicted nucleotidyltransferase